MYRSLSFKNFKDLLYRAELYGKVELDATIYGIKQELLIHAEDNSYQFIIKRTDEELYLSEHDAFKLFNKLRYNEKNKRPLPKRYLPKWVK